MGFDVNNPDIEISSCTSVPGAVIATSKGPRTFLQDNHFLEKITQDCLENFSDADIIDVFKSAYQELKLLVNNLPEAEKAGSTITVVGLFNEKIFRLQLGDSFALTITTNTQPINHQCITPLDRKKIQVDLSKTESYCLNTGSSMGDKVLQNAGLNQEPIVLCSKFNIGKNKLLISTDGLSEKLTDAQIAEEIATGDIKNLVTKAYQQGCTDNTKVICLPFEKGTWQKQYLIVAGVCDGHDLVELNSYFDTPKSQFVETNHGNTISEFLCQNFPIILKKHIERKKLCDAVLIFIDLATSYANSTQIQQLQQLGVWLKQDLLAAESDEIFDDKMAQHMSLAGATFDMIAIVNSVEHSNHEKLSAIQSYRRTYFPEKTAPIPEEYQFSYTAKILMLIGAIIGAAIGAVIGGLCTFELGFVGAFPGGWIGASKGASCVLAIYLALIFIIKEYKQPVIVSYLYQKTTQALIKDKTVTAAADAALTSVLAHTLYS
jgi:serine/threonine protein phosphatase PrpC